MSAERDRPSCRRVQGEKLAQRCPCRHLFVVWKFLRTPTDTHLQRSSSTACYLQTWYRNSQVVVVVEMLRIKLNPADTGTCPQNLPRETVRNFRRIHHSYKIRRFRNFECVQNCHWKTSCLIIIEKIKCVVRGVVLVHDNVDGEFFLIFVRRCHCTFTIFDYFP